MIANYWRGVGLALTTALFWGASAPITKIISADGLSPLSVMVYRCILISIVLGGWLCAKKGARALLLSRRMLRIYVVLGFTTIVCMGGGYMVSCAYLTVPQAVILHYTFPLLTLMGDTWIMHERPRFVQVAAAILILVGVYVGFDMGGTGLVGISVSGVGWGVISVFGFAGQALMTRAVARDGTADPIVQVFFVHLFGGIMLLIGKSVLMGWGDIAGVTPRIFALMHYMVFASGLLAFICLFASLKYISATAMSLICSLEIVIALSVTPLLLGRGSTVQEWIGSAIIMIAVACSTLGKHKPAAELRTAD